MTHECKHEQGTNLCFQFHQCAVMQYAGHISFTSVGSQYAGHISFTSVGVQHAGHISFISAGVQYPVHIQFPIFLNLVTL